MSFNFTILIELAAAAYLLICAASGKSRIFYSPYTKKGLEQKYKKTARIGFVVLGLLMIVMAITNSFAGAQSPESALFNTLYTINLVASVVVLTALLVLLFLLNRMHDKAKKSRPAQSQAPRAAFYFDDEDQGEKKQNDNSTKKSKK